MTNCIACNYPVTYPLFHPEDQPLAALYLPSSTQDARDINCYPMQFHTCANCGHIFNIAFDYSKVFYENNSNLMYNTGGGWTDYMDALAKRLCKTYKAGTWVEIGCGDGNFLERIKKLQPESRVIGFEPGLEARNAAKREGVEAVEDYFVPKRDLRKLKPDYLICRHVIEHLQNPKDFITEINYWCNYYNIFPVFVAEVPCMDKAISHARINDYLYEHVSNFTSFSFGNMFEVAGYEVLHIERGYGDEVVVAEVKPKPVKRLKDIQKSTEQYRANIDGQFKNIGETLESWKKQKKKVAFWGGTGKSAAFLNNFNIMVEDFPIVVDSDYKKVGKFVPRTAQEIRAPEHIQENQMDIIVITTQWRAKDIYEEIKRRNIKFDEIYVLLDRKLTPYHGETI